MFKRLLLSTIFFAFIAHSETELSGSIGGKIFDKSGSPYVVTDDIVIEQNQNVVIKAGSVFLFKNFCGIIVKGSLHVEGEEGNPVVFTSVNDQKHSVNAVQLANPFDWNGIIIMNSSTNVVMSNFYLAYSVYGIKSEKEVLTIKNGMFKANGQFHFTINDVVKPVVDNYPYSYVYGSVNSNESISVTKSSSSSPRQISSKKSSAVPLLLGAVGVLSGGVCGLLTVKSFDTHKLFVNEVDPLQLSKLKKQGANETLGAIVSGSVCAISIPIAVIIAKRNKQQQSSTLNYHISPMICGNLGGCTLSFHF